MTLFRPGGVTIIAEIGTNHNGSLDTAVRLIELAAEAGADVVKFQSFLVDELLPAGDPNYDRLKQLELPKAWYPRLMERCAAAGVRFLSTATNFTTLQWMEDYGCDGYKIASCNITHRPLIDRLVTIGKPIIISCGMANLDEIRDLAAHLARSSLPEFAFLHCVSRYPTPASEMRLRNIEILGRLLPCPVGFSDHSLGTALAVAAVTLGARVVEKHLSLDRSGPGMDHDVAILPLEFRDMCAAIRDVEKALFVDFTPDRDNIRRMRRSIRFVRPLRSGETVQETDLKVTRPEDGLLPAHICKVVGRTLARGVEAEQPVSWADFGLEVEP